MKTLILIYALVGSVAQAEFYDDFRGKALDQLHVAPARPGTENFFTATPEGLRIVRPADSKPLDLIGVAPEITLRGNFEITAGYEIVSHNLPSAGPDLKVDVYLKTRSPATDALAFYRVVTSGGVDEYRYSRMTTNDRGKRQGLSGVTLGDTKASGQSGQLRITRVDADVTLAAAEPAGAAFRDLVRVPLGVEDVTRLRFAIYPGSVADFADVRLVDLRVRETGRGGENSKSQRGRGTLWLLLTLFTFLTIGIIWIVLGKKRRSSKEREQEPSAQ